MIQFTISEAMATILYICGGIVTVAAVVSVVVRFIQFLRRPKFLQDDRIAAIENRIDVLEAQHDAYDKFFDNDKKRLDRIDEGNRVTQHALLALLAHGIDGNDTDALKNAKHELERYLISR